MPSTILPNLSEDDIDDLLYFARTSSLSDIQSTLTHLSKSLSTTPHNILLPSIDPHTGNGVLHMASANGHTEMISYILTILPTPPANSALLNAQNSSGNTPLHWASLNGHLGAVKLLIGAGADPGIVNAAGHDAVYEAEVNGKDDVVEWLLKECMGLEKAVGNVDEGVQETEGEGEKEIVDGMEGMAVGIEERS